MRRPTLALAAVLVAACASPAPQTDSPALGLAAAASGPSAPRVLAKSARTLRPSRSKPRPAVTPTPRPAAIGPGRKRPPVGFTTWRRSATARRVLACESHTNYTDMSRHGGVIYYGAWQANAGFWRAYGGDPRYLADRSRFTAPAWMQDAVAYRGWLARGWQPWACA